MSNFTPLVTKKFSFEGDEVTVKFARLKRKHMLKMLPLMTKFSDTVDGIDEDGMSPAQAELVQDVMAELGDRAGEYIKSLEGLTDAAGNPITVEQFTEDSYFMTLFADLLVEMMEASVGPSGKE